MRTERHRKLERLLGTVWNGINESSEVFSDAAGFVDPDPKLAEKAGKLAKLLSGAWVFFDGHLDGRGGKP